MNKNIKLLSVLLVTLTMCHLNGMIRTFQRTMPHIRPTISIANQMATAARFSLLATAANRSTAPQATQLKTPKAPLKATAKAPFVTTAWKKIFPAKKNDPIQLETNVRKAIDQNNTALFDETLRHNQELLQKNNHHFMRKHDSVPYLIQASGHGIERDMKLISSLITHCPSEINEVFINPVTQASGERRLPYCDHPYASPLSTAAQHNHHDTAEKLLEGGAQANATTGNPHYPTILTQAAVQNRELRTVQTLLNFGAQVNFAGYNALDIARRAFAQHHQAHYEEEILAWLEAWHKHQSQ